MSDEFFTKLLESIREGGAILRGEKEPSHQFVMDDSGIKPTVMHQNTKNYSKKNSVNTEYVLY